MATSCSSSVELLLLGARDLFKTEKVWMQQIMTKIEHVQAASSPPTMDFVLTQTVSQPACLPAHLPAR